MPRRALSERLLAHAASVGAKVIAIGDPGQLPSVQAGGWLRAVGARLGAVRLREVMRQRDPAERLALAALHDGNPRRWIEWAERRRTRRSARSTNAAGTCSSTRRRASGPPASTRHGRSGSRAVLIAARDGDTRRALQRARARAPSDRELRADARRGTLLRSRNSMVAVGDRVICRDNDRDLDVDNGTRGTVRHVDRAPGS